MSPRYAARILECDYDKKHALIHFDQWNKRFDEWIEFGSNRIRPLSEAALQARRSGLPLMKGRTRKESRAKEEAERKR